MGNIAQILFWGMLGSGLWWCSGTYHMVVIGTYVFFAAYGCWSFNRKESVFEKWFDLAWPAVALGIYLAMYF